MKQLRFLRYSIYFGQLVHPQYYRLIMKNLTILILETIVYLDNLEIKHGMVQNKSLIRNQCIRKLKADEGIIHKLVVSRDFNFLVNEI